MPICIDTLHPSGAIPGIRCYPVLRGACIWAMLSLAVRTHDSAYTQTHTHTHTHTHTRAVWPNMDKDFGKGTCIQRRDTLNSGILIHTVISYMQGESRYLFHTLLTCNHQIPTAFQMLHTCISYHFLLGRVQFVGMSARQVRACPRHGRFRDGPSVGGA